MRTLLLGAVIPEREVRNHQREIESVLQHFHLGMPSSTRVRDLRHFLHDDTNWPPLAPSAVVPRTLCQTETKWCRQSFTVCFYLCRAPRWRWSSTNTRTTNPAGTAKSDVKKSTLTSDADRVKPPAIAGCWFSVNGDLALFGANKSWILTVSATGASGMLTWDLEGCLRRVDLSSDKET